MQGWAGAGSVCALLGRTAFQGPPGQPDVAEINAHEGLLENRCNLAAIDERFHEVFGLRASSEARTELAVLERSV